MANRDWRYADESLTTLVKPAGGRARGRRAPGEMNTTEGAYARHLQLRLQTGEILWWAFEGVKFQISKGCFYTPDFDILLADGFLECHDVKGTRKERRTTGEQYERAYYEEDARVKLAACASLFPITFRMVFKGSDGNWNETEMDGSARS